MATAAEALANAGEHYQAEASAHSITDAGQRERAFAAVVVVLAKVGKDDWAEALSGLVTDPDQQARVLVALSEQVEPAKARRLVARALRAAGWMATIDALVRIEPAAFTASVDEFLSLDR